MLNFKPSLIACLLILMSALVMSSCGNSKTYEAPAAKKIIPNQPNSVKGRVTKLPKGPLNDKQTQNLLKDYENNEILNNQAISDSQRYHKKIQKLHNR